jgi:F-type H+-transporting ATPase subunit epsilon
MDDTFRLRIVTPYREVVMEDVSEAQIPGREGYLGVLPGHAPLISELKVGEVSYKRGGKSTHLAVSGGFVEVLPDQVTILAETAERSEEIDVARAKAAKEQAEKLLHAARPETDLDLATVALERALVRLQVAAKGGRGL